MNQVVVKSNVPYALRVMNAPTVKLKELAVAHLITVQEASRVASNAQRASNVLILPQTQFHALQAISQ